MMGAPEINSSTREERENYIKTTYKCIANCDMCGLCQIFHGKQPEVVFSDYIDGKREYLSVAADYKG